MKEITLPVCELKAALPGLSKIVGRMRTLPVLQSVRVARDVEGKISLLATDLDSFATYTAKEAQAGPAMEMLVPLDQLTKTAKALKSESAIGLVPDGKDKVKLRFSIAGNMVEQTVSGLPVAEFPPVPQIKQPSIPLESGFGAALRQALECCSEDSSRRILNGACLDVMDKKFHYVVGTNGRALFSANSFCFDLQKSVVIPDSKFLTWSDFLGEEPCSLSLEPGQEEQPAKDGKPATVAQPGWVKLQSGRWSFITKEIEGIFPNWKQVVPTTTGKWTRIHLSEEAIRQLILLTPNLPGDYGPNYPVRLRVNDHLVIEGQNKDEEQWTSIPIQNVTVTGKPVSVALNRRYLLNALRFGLNQFEVEDALTPVLFSNAGKKMIIMPVNLGENTPAPAPATATPSEATTTPAAEQTQPQPNPEAPTEERTVEMPRTAAKAPEAVTRESQTAEAQNNNAISNGNNSSVKSLVEHVDQIKDALKNVIRELSELADALKQAEKEKRTSDKEIEAIRTKLRQIQSVTI